MICENKHGNHLLYLACYWKLYKQVIDILWPFMKVREIKEGKRLPVKITVIYGTNFLYVKNWPMITGSNDRDHDSVTKLQVISQP